jgi:hypothetical protein
MMPITGDQKLLVTEGIELHQALIEKLQDEPTPAGPTQENWRHSNKEKRMLSLSKTRNDCSLGNETGREGKVKGA